MDHTPADPPLEALTDPALGPLFRRPMRTGVESAWYGHVPFAHWVVAATRPRLLVELGSHNGVSYSAFCEAVMDAGLDTRCFAVDTWEGDDHAGFYGAEVFADLQRFNAAAFGGFSELLRCRFDEALPYIPDAAVDLLHIDGRHGYEDVRHDFESWAPKLSDRAVVLFHDTNVRERGFGVWRLFAELAGHHPHFEFLHGHGLGVLAHGASAPPALLALCALGDPARIALIRERFALIGERWIADRDITERQAALARVTRELGETRAWGTDAQNEVNRLFPLYRDLLDANRAARGHLAIARHDLAIAEQDVARLRQEAELGGAERAALAAALEAARQEAEALRAERQALLGSRTWRLAASLRRAAAWRGAAPPPSEEAPAPAPEPPPPAPAAEPRALFISGEPETPGHAYRVVRMAEAARALGWQADIMEAGPVGPGDLADRAMVVIWRATWSTHIQGIIDVAHENGATVLFDVDDLMFRPELATTETIDAIRSLRFSELATQSFFADIQRTMLECDIVTCTTEELARHIRRLGKPAMVVPNCFDDVTASAAGLARRNWHDCADGLLRIGYAGGTRTHQKDFLEAAPAVARFLRTRQDARLVLFRDPRSGEGLVLLDEYPEFAELAAQIEWRNMVALPDLPAEIARFDINLAPLEAGNPFCEAKSELKYFEAALASVPTIASPTGPFRRAIRDGVTGLLASGEEAWHAALTRLAEDAAFRAAMAEAAHHDALASWGPERRRRAWRSVIEQSAGGEAASLGFARDLKDADARPADLPHIPPARILFRQDRLQNAALTVIVPVYNYADYAPEALQSVASQTLPLIDLVIIDDCSTDDSVQIVQDWIGANRDRFNRLLFLQHTENAGLGFGRNSGFAAAATPFVLPLDADNRLRPAAAETLLAALGGTNAAYAYPAIQQFGDKSATFGGEPYSPLRLVRGNIIDAMALVRKSAWAAAGGYDHVRYGWEDYDFWCRLAERGLYGVGVPEVLADYRVHTRSMLHTQTEVRGHKLELIADLERRHPWLDIPTEVD